MADVINRETKRIYRSVNTPDYPEPEFMVINCKILPSCEEKYWKIVDDKIVEMSTKEKAVVDYVAPPPEPTVEELALHAANERRQNIKIEIEKTYLLTDEIGIIREALVKMLPDDVDVQAWNDVVVAAKAKYPKT